MGCIFSLCNKSKKQDDINTPLFNNHRCFICNKTFSSNNEYNKHIPHCNFSSLNKK